MPRPSLGDRLFRVLLRLFPAEFRGDFGEDMSADFQEQRDEARRRGGAGAVRRLWIRTVLDAVRRAPREQAATLGEDLRYAVRMMRHHLASSVAIVVLLAVGIGANVAVFDLAGRLLLRPLPVPAGEDLVRIVRQDSEGAQIFSHPFFLDLAARNRVFAGVAAHQYTTVAFGQGEHARAMSGEIVSGNYFDVLGVQPALGRMLRPSDDETVGAHSVAVISHGTWREVFGGAPDVVGRIVHLNGHAFEIVGVAPRGFSGSYTAFASRFWAPVSMYRQVRPRAEPLTRRGWGWLALTARLRPGVGPTQAGADVDRVAAELQREFPTADSPGRYGAVQAQGLPEGMRRSALPVMLFAGTITALVLLVTCANVAGVLQSRALARVRETSIRYALGATRFRVIRQWLTESVALATLGALAGLAAARWMDRGLVALVGDAVPVELSGQALADVRVLAFTFLLAVAAGLLFGLLPALRSAVRGEQALREHAASMTMSRAKRRATSALVALQVAVSVALIVTAALLARSLRNATTFDPGFDGSSLVVATVDVRRHGYDTERAGRYYDALLERLRSRPDVRAVSRAAVVPLGGDVERLGFVIPGYQPPDGKGYVSIDVNAVAGDYFATMGIPVVRGRALEATDSARAPAVAVVNETMARRFWPGRDAIGQTFRTAGQQSLTFRVVGVARDIKYYALDEQAMPYLYVAAAQVGAQVAVVHASVTGAPGPVIAAIRREAAALEPGVAVQQATTFEELRRQPLAMRRLMAVVAGTFSALALGLALMGIYGTMASAVGRRTREIGVRMAFGASVRDVYGLVLREGLRPVVIGVAGGLAAAGLLTGLVAGELFGVAPGDPLTYAATTITVVVAASAALSVPALRAARVDPAVTLRE